MNYGRKTLQLLQTAKHGRIGIRSFQQIVPDIARQIREDANSPWLECWGKSVNFDEYELAKIVDPKILTVIGRLSNYPILSKGSYHAGLTHTYGYLLSVLKTRFGYKRERWTSGKLEGGLGLEDSFFSPTPRSGTLLENVTRFLSRISLSTRDRAKYFSQASDSETLAGYRFDRLKIQRIQERVRSAGQGGFQIFTDLVDFRHKQANASTLLIYSLSQGKQPRKLITCFPIPAKEKKALLANAEQNQTPIRLRFNASVPGFPKDGAIGNRSIKTLKL